MLSVLMQIGLCTQRVIITRITPYANGKIELLSGKLPLNTIGSQANKNIYIPVLRYSGISSLTLTDANKRHRRRIIMLPINYSTMLDAQIDPKKQMRKQNTLLQIANPI